MMPIPVYALTGFLDSGKTSLLNDLLNRSDWRNIKMLVIQFEAGEEEFRSRHPNCESISFSKKSLEQEPEQIVHRISSLLEKNSFEEVWIEWNGMVPFSQLQSFFLHSSLRNLCKIQKVIHVADAKRIESLLGRTGGALPEQIANSDFALIRNTQPGAELKQVKRLFRGINPGVSIYKAEVYDDFYRKLFEKKESSVSFFFMVMVIIASLYFLARPVLDMLGVPVNTVINIFLGIILQAVPFLLIGVLLSSAIQVFVPQSAIERRFPKSLGMGILVAVLSGFCLPVCDCASIPIFRSLVKKGIPLPAAITFMAASPVINPVVMLSTYYAFSGDLKVVINRVLFGIIAAVITGLVFAVWPPKDQVLSGGVLDRLMCSCGCYEDVESITTLKGKIGLFIRHSQAEFFSVGKYLMVGSFIAAIFQVLGTGIFTKAQNGAGLAVSIVIMMIMAFVLSLCSSSDAVVARSFARQFPMGGIMGFLVFGPIMDIKNVMMLSAGFSKRFIIRLLFTSFMICFTVVFLFSVLGGL